MNEPTDIRGVAKRMVWFKAPEETLADPVFFLAHLMTFGTAEDVAVARRYFSPEQFLHALESAPPGVFDARSWSYWNLILGRWPAPPMPKRNLS